MTQQRAKSAMIANPLNYCSVNWQKKSCTKVFVHSYILLLLQEKLYPFKSKINCVRFVVNYKVFILCPFLRAGPMSKCWQSLIFRNPLHPHSSLPGPPPSCWIHLSSTVPLNMDGGCHLLCFYVYILIHV